MAKSPSFIAVDVNGRNALSISRGKLVSRRGRYAADYSAFLKANKLFKSQRLHF
jgi:hypothetical protein